MDKKRIIYDFGMHNGDDTEYYLRKGFRVVGVEANPKMCEDCLRRFKLAIKDGDLVVLNLALSDKSSPNPVRFFVHKKDPGLSQLNPQGEDISEYREIFVKPCMASEIVRDYGEPYYIKIDIEHSDAIVLSDLFTASIFPTFISAESHSIDVFCLLVNHGYTLFNLVDGPSLRSTYKNVVIETKDGKQKYSFGHNSSGPFGEDITTPWMTKDVFFWFLQAKGLGWKDIHATKMKMSNKIDSANFRRQMIFRDHIYDLLPSLVRALKYRIGL